MYDVSLSFLMEEKPWKFNLLSSLISVSSDPLFSTLVTFYTLVIIYFPSLFLGIVFSPVLISTSILLLTLLRLGAIQRIEKEFKSYGLERGHRDSNIEYPKCVSLESKNESQIGSITPSENENCTVTDSNLTETETYSCSGLDPKIFYTESFIKWDVRAPLEVIYEEYEDEDDDDVGNEKAETHVLSIDRYASLSLYYPESDSDSSSDGDYAGMGGWESQENMCFRWDEENIEELIEIAFDGRRTSSLLYCEEENLIEIDLSPARKPVRNVEIAGEG